MMVERVRCFLLGHVWFEILSATRLRPPLLIEVSLCERCGKVKGHARRRDPTAPTDP